MQEYLIWLDTKPSLIDRVLGFFKSPEELNYKVQTSRLHPVEEMFRGELVEIKYYRHYDPATDKYSDLRICVTYEWERDTNNRLRVRWMTHKWTIVGSTDEEPLYGDAIKREPKYYNDQKSRLADIRRRKNIVEELTTRASEFGAEIPNQKMRLALDHSFGPYIDTGNPQLINDVQTYVDPDNIPWLEAMTSVYVPEHDIRIDLSVRDAIMAQLSLGAVT